MKTKQLTLCAFFTILYILGSRITIPTGIIPLTLQTMMVIIAGILLRPKEILASYGVYFLMGFVGLPVFASGGGLSYVLQPSFGFLLSFPFAACLISALRHKYELTHFYQLYPLCLCALCFIYLIGCGYMYLIFNYYMGSAKDISSIIAIGAAPFVISDSISMAVGCFCAIRLSMVSSIKRILIKTFLIEQNILF